MKRAVHPHTGKAFGLEFFKLVLMRALLQFYQRRQHHKLFALGQGQNVRNDFVRGAGLNGPSALGAVHAPQPGVEHAQKVVDFRHRAHCGARIA